MNPDALLKRLDLAMVEAATTAMAQPQGRDAFEYGRRVGIYVGLDIVKQHVLDLLAEDDTRDI